MRSTRASEDCMRPSARLFGLTRFGIACEDALEVCSLIERDLSWRLPVCMDAHVDVGDAIMPALRVQRDTYCRFRAAYRRVCASNGQHARCRAGMANMYRAGTANCDTAGMATAGMAHTNTAGMADRYTADMANRYTAETANRYTAGMANCDTAEMATAGMATPTAGMATAGMANCEICDTAEIDITGIATAETAAAGMATTGMADNTKTQRDNHESVGEKAVKYHMQRKLLGYIMHNIYKAHDFMAMFCYEDQRGFITNNVKEILVRLNKALTPWYLAYGQITKHKRLQQIAQWKHQGHHQGKCCVYARVAIRSNKALYIGETQDLNARIGQHYCATCKHRDEASNKCKRCKEHGKYKKHRVAPPHEWLTIPITYAATKMEVKKIESNLIRILKPNLNVADKPFWLLKDNYAQQCKNYCRRRKESANTPWKGNKDNINSEGNRHKRLYATYICLGNTFMDILPILRGATTETVTVTVNPGHHDLTNWRKIRQQYGSSIVYTQGNTIQLRDWKIDSVQTREIRIKQTDPPDFKELANIFKDIKQFTEQLKRASDDDLSFYWRIRHLLQKNYKYKARSLIWKECINRYNCNARPIEIRLPYFTELNPQKVNGWVRTKIEQTEWPDFIKTWHMSKIRIITESQPSVSQILCNVTSPFNDCTGTCPCQQIYQRLRAKGLNKQLPEINGHIFGIGRDYQGPNSEALQTAANNIPQQTQWDLHRAWDKVYSQLPTWIQPTKNKWANLLKDVTIPPVRKPRFLTTKSIYTLRKDLKGLIIGPLDKNTNELWYCCPTLYQQAWKKTFEQNTDYQHIIPKKAKCVKGHIDQAYDMDTLRQPGTTKDIINLWERTYKHFSWHHIAPYNKKGDFNRPYLLFKSKNVTEHDVRIKKWEKARPIAPQTKHPMSKLFHLAGRAWSFITSNIPGEHFTLNKIGQLQEFFTEVEDKLAVQGKIHAQVKDIEGCFCNMPKQAITEGLQQITELITDNQGYKAVYVPCRGRHPCRWKPRKGYKELRFSDLLDIMNFALENTIIKHMDGSLYKQVRGIPMGDPHSPGMAIGACAFMERKWLQTLSPEFKKSMLAKRYMDDILIFSIKNIDVNTILQRCYTEPLKLEDTQNDTFLETTFKIVDNKIQHWLKNENHPHQTKVWRYAHFHSNMAFKQKKAVLQACLRKVHLAASDNAHRRASAIQKLQEFGKLQYPYKLLWTICTTMGVQTRNAVWFQVRDDMR